MEKDLTKGSVTKSIFLFALPLMLANLLQQLYNIADTWVVGKYIGSDALGAVGSAYSLMTFLTSVLIGLCMGASAFFSMQYGSKEYKRLRRSIFMSFILISILSIFLTIIVYIFIDEILYLLKVPSEVLSMMKTYLIYIFIGIPAVFLYNYFSNLLRSIGNSLTPLFFLAFSAILNVFLDLYCVINLNWGVAGAAIATSFSQYVSGIAICIYTCIKYKELLPKKDEMYFEKNDLKNISNLSLMTSLQQSIMNFGILMVQGLVNSFGTSVMAAFAAAVKIDSFAYMPVQDFGNAFSTFVAQNYGAKKEDRIKEGIKSAVISSMSFSIFISIIVWIFSKQLLGIFIDTSNIEIINIGVNYLHIEGAFYCLIGLLFLLYGYYRAINIPLMSLILTIASLGTRVLLAYILSSIPSLNVNGIWMSVPIGWALADSIGIIYYFKLKNKLNF